MKKAILVAAAMAVCCMGVRAEDFYSLKFTTIEGGEYDFAQLRGKYVLIVNTASACGYTKQYAALQELARQYAGTLMVLGFPCNQFGAQESGTNSEIAQFCSKNYGVTFPIMEKSDVRGDTKNVVYKWLTTKDANGWNEQQPEWNFCKYLVDPKGKLLQYFPSKIEPTSAEITGYINNKRKSVLIKNNE